MDPKKCRDLKCDGISLEHDRAILFSIRDHRKLMVLLTAPSWDRPFIPAWMKTGARQRVHTCRCNCSWWWGRYHYLLRQDESLINGRLIGFLDDGVITPKRGLVNVDGKGSERYRFQCTYRVFSLLFLPLIKSFKQTIFQTVENVNILTIWEIWRENNILLFLPISGKLYFK